MESLGSGRPARDRLRFRRLNTTRPCTTERPFLAFLSWIYSVTLGFVQLACAKLSPQGNTNSTFEGNLESLMNKSIGDLLMWGFNPILLMVSTTCAVLVAPVAVWTLRTGKRNLILYGTLLWGVLATYIIFPVITFPPPLGGLVHHVSLLLISYMGLIVIALVPRK